MNSNRKGSGTDVTRRGVLAGMGTTLIGITTGSSWGGTGAAQTNTQSSNFQPLASEELRTLEALADVLLPGAREAGIARYINDQLSRDVPLLFLKYMDYPGSFIDFYKTGLQALNHESRSRYGLPFDACGHEQKITLVQELSQASPQGWSGPPAPLFYLVLRNDAVDVYYGTPQGFDKLGVPYSALLEPPKAW